MYFHILTTVKDYVHPSDNLLVGGLVLKENEPSNDDEAEMEIDDKKLFIGR